MFVIIVSDKQPGFRSGGIFVEEIQVVTELEKMITESELETE